MALGNFTRQTLENDTANAVGDAIAALNRLAQLQERAAAENAAGTLGQDDFYGDGSDPTLARDKTNVLGTLDDMKAMRDYAVSHGTLTAPADPLRYAVFVF